MQSKVRGKNNHKWVMDVDFIPRSTLPWESASLRWSSVAAKALERHQVAHFILLESPQWSLESLVTGLEDDCHASTYISEPHHKREAFKGIMTD